MPVRKTIKDRSIQGSILDQASCPVEGVRVSAFDRNLSVDDILLGQVTTDPKGHYFISYGTSKLKGKSAADLVVCVYQDQQLLYTSDIIFNAPPQVTQDVLVSLPPVPEFNRIFSQVRPLLSRKAGWGGLASAQTDFLSRKTGVDSLKLDRLLRSQSLSQGEQTQAIFYYGLIAQNLPTDPGQLLQMDRAVVRRALDQAVRRHLIPSLDPRLIDTMFEVTLPGLRIQRLLEPAAAGQPATLGDWLKTMPVILPDGLKIKVAEFVGRDGIDFNALGAQLRVAGLNSDQAFQVERTLRLADLTCNHPPLMLQLQPIGAGHHLANYPLSDLPELRVEQWIDLVYSCGMPTGLRCDQETYARQIATAVEEMYPAEALAARLEQGALTFRRAGFENVSEFLRQNPGFDIRSANIPVFMKQACLANLESGDVLTQSLLKLQRIKKLSASWEEIGFLVDCGFDSARQIVAAGPQRLKQRLARAMPAQRVEMIYNRAKQAHDAGLAVMVCLQPKFSPAPVVAMGQTVRLDLPMMKNLLKDSPALQDIFGSLNYNQCRPNESVLSPAAYFVDLLEFLENTGTLHALLARRADLTDIVLSDKNTDEKMPYIDLVLEILENAVALPVTLALPAGQSGAELLQQTPLPGSISGVLQRTTRATIGHDVLAAKFVKQFPGDHADSYVVADQSRRWTLRNVVRGLGLMIAEYQWTDYIRQADLGDGFGQVVQELNGQKLSADAKKYLRRFISRECGNDRYMYLDIAADAVAVTQPGTFWKIQARFGVDVRLVVARTEASRGSQVFLSTPDGEILYHKENCSIRSVLAAQRGLQDGRIRGALVGLINPHAMYTITHSGTDAWSVRQSPFELWLTYSPDKLTVAALTYQTTGESADLQSSPANQNPLAYDILRQAKFPWSLPFNLPWETVRACLEKTGYTRRQLLELMLPENYLFETRCVNEVLGFSREEAELIAQPQNEFTLWPFWGLAADNFSMIVEIFDAQANQTVSGCPMSLLSRLSILMQQARISYSDLLRILNTEFVKAEFSQGLSIVLQDASGSKDDPSNLFIQINGMLPGNTVLFDRIHRFVRLWSRLGWEIEELDMAIQSLPPFDQSLDWGKMTGLSHIFRLQELLGQPVKELVQWRVKDFSISYAELFLNPLAQHPMDSDFLLNTERNGLLNSGKKLSEKGPVIAAALGIRQDDVNVMRVQLGLADQLNLDNLFLLLRVSRLIKALGITVQDYFLAVSLTGLAPFDGTDVLIQFCQVVRFIQRSGFSLSELAYLLRDVAMPGLTLVPDADQWNAWLAEIRSGLQSGLESIAQSINTRLGADPAGRDLVDLDPLDTNRLVVVLAMPAVRAALMDIICGKLSVQFGLEMMAVRKLLISDRRLFASFATASAILKDPSDKKRDGIEVFLDPAFVGQTALNSRNTLDLLRRLHKVSLLFSRLKVRLPEMDWAGDTATGMQTMDFNLLPVSEVPAAPDLLMAWQRLVTLFSIRDRFAGMSALLTRYVSNLQACQQNGLRLAHPQVKIPEELLPGIKPPAGSNAQLHRLLKWLGDGLSLPSDLDTAAIAAQLKFTGLSDYRNPARMGQVIQLLVVMKTLGARFEDVQLLIQDWPNRVNVSPAFDLAAQAETLSRALLRSRYGSSVGRDLIRPITDQLRIRQRDVLVDYLVFINGLRDSNDLYDYYLIDPQMSPGMMTSRLVQATATVQLFVQQCFLDMTTLTVPLNADDRKRWEWMKNYRVWEANRRIFLYPENWLHPELRGDKTRIFSDLQGGLAQGEPGDQLARSRMLEYLDGLGEVAKIQVYGIYESVENVGQVSARCLYIVGRSPNQPYSYYWRKCTAFLSADQMQWNGWERIDLDISDDHLIPFVLEGNFYIAWPTITQKSNNNDPAQAKPPKIWEIRLNWARRTSKGWTVKKMSKESMPLPDWNAILCQGVNDPARELTFRIGHDLDDNLAFYVYNNIYQIFDPTLYPGCSTTVPIPCSAIQLYDMGQLIEDIVNYVAASAVTVQLYDEYQDLSQGKTWYNLARKTKIYVRYWHVTNIKHWQSESLFQLHKTDEGFMDSRGQFVSSLELKDLETGEAGIKYLVRVDISSGSMPGETILATFDAALNAPLLKSWHLVKVISQTTYTRQVRPVGKFILTETEDVRVSQIMDTQAVPDNQEAIYCNGYMGIPGQSLADLKLYPDNAYGAVSFTISPVNPQGQLCLTMPAAQAPEVKALGQVNRLADERIWSYEDAGNKLYIFAALLKTGSGNLLSWLGVRDNVRDSAALRTVAGKKFEDLYRLSSQQLLGHANFLSNQYWGDSAGSVFTDFTGFANSDIVQPNGFALSAPPAIYNWEIFFHTPLMVAEFLTRQQRFGDAQAWLHYIFDPANPVNDGQTFDAARYWQFQPFRENASGERLQDLFAALARLAANPQEKSSDTAAIQHLNNQLAQWMAEPFSPFAIARYRWSAYQWRTLFAYLDNLIAWGDQMFRRFTRESVNESLQYYVLAAKLLGPRPKEFKTDRLSSAALSYRDIHGGWEAFSQAWYAITDIIPLSDADRPADVVAMTALGMSCFGVPQNDKLTGYWDTVEDRLFKLRNCQDIDGSARELALFAPPIDPDLLVRAAAAGLDIQTVLSDQEAPQLPYRFTVLSNKAADLALEVKALGGALLAALEKNDAEALARLRATQELDILRRVLDIKQQQIDEAKATVASLEQSQRLVLERVRQYQKLLGKANVALGADGLPVLETTSVLRVAANAPGDDSGLGMVQNEVSQLASLDSAHNYQKQSAIANTIAGVLHCLPEFQMGAICSYIHIGGNHLGNAATAVAEVLGIKSADAGHDANKQGIFAQYQRRQDDWVHESRLALEEMKQINRQTLAASIRLAMAEKERENHQHKIDNAMAVNEFMHGKYTNQELYSWMEGEVAKIYFTCYLLAFDMARRAEKAFQNELGLDSASTGFIQLGYWDSLKKGLLSGERLSLDLKRLEVAYLEENQRELEITRHVSLAQVAPSVLLNLKESGECLIDLPEALFDRDYPGHYFRRIKSVSLTIVCSAGTYTNINCTLTLQASHLRVKTTLLTDPDSDPYARVTKGNDARFRDDPVSRQAIATSSGQDDSGLFEVNFQDERYLPFEGLGAISSWRLQMPKACNAFDMNSISDVVMHLKYTARDGGENLARYALAAATPAMGAAVISASRESADEWIRFLNVDGNVSGQQLDVSLWGRHFPFLLRNKTIMITQVDVYLQPGEGADLINLLNSLRMTLAPLMANPSQDSPGLTFSSSPGNALLRATLGDGSTSLAKFRLQGNVALCAWKLQCQKNNPGADGSGLLNINNVLDVIYVFQYLVEP